MEKTHDIAILVVDDEEPNLTLFRMVFEKKYQILTANSAKDGLEKLRLDDGKIIAVFSDLKMPFMDGLKFIEKAREKNDSISYFILSSYFTNKELESAVDKSVIDGFFLKPFDTNEIEECIENVKFQRKVRM